MISAKTPLLTTGVSGLVGSQFAAQFSDTFEIDNLDISHPTRPVDITNQAAVFRCFEESAAPAVIHLAAYTDVSKSWEQRGDTSGIAYQVNVVGTKNIVAAAEAYGKHLIFVSTAYVFDGQKESMYVETDQTNPIEWYGNTKALAEEAVQASSAPWTIVRIDQPFRSDPGARPDIVRRIITGLEKGSLPPQFIDHTFGPTFIDDFSRILDWVVHTRTTGLFHASSGEQWTDFAFASALQQSLSLPGKIEKGMLSSYLATLSRPYQKNTALDVTKLKALLPFSLCTITEALTKIR